MKHDLHLVALGMRIISRMKLKMQRNVNNIHKIINSSQCGEKAHTFIMLFCIINLAFNLRLFSYHKSIFPQIFISSLLLNGKSFVAQKTCYRILLIASPPTVDGRL